MSRIYTTVFLAAIVLTGAMGLKTALGARANSSVLMANGSAPMPPPWKDTLTAANPLQNGSAPMPPPWKDTLAAVKPLQNGSAPMPPPWKDTLAARKPLSHRSAAATPKSW
jgi:hypothetical protein